MFTPRPRFGDQTPPAIFPPLLGAFGLGLAWRRAGEVFAAPTAVSELILGAVTLLFLFCLVAYGIKVRRRPGVVIEDLRVLPGRAGLAALVLSLYLLAATLVPLARPLAEAVLWAGLALHLGLVALVIRGFLTGPAEQRAVTPVWHLLFVGFIVAPIAALPLGHVGLSTVIFYGAGAAAAVIWTLSLVQLIRRDVPVPLRPLLAIHLAPACLLGTVAMLLDRPGAALVLAGLAGAILAALLVRLAWVIRAGFTPLWGAFTFPLAAFASLMLTLAAAGQGGAFRLVGAVALIGASLAIPAIAAKVMQAWAKGGLGPKTNAARV
ncbi:MAG: tellurium resistance protein [Rhodobacteraceae bacterium]|nr:tellurium resistance protein [Paracoccaceae bacterium]